jgi:hypothetical protein
VRRTTFSRPPAGGGATVSTYAYRLKKALTPIPPVRYLCLRCRKAERPKDSPDRLCEGCR